MKTVILALLVLSAVSQNEALRCNCGGIRHCPNPVETCPGSNYVCARIEDYFGPTPIHTKGCMKSDVCASIIRPPITTATCCTTDLCNS